MLNCSFFHSSLKSQGGSLLAIGMLHTGVRSEQDAPVALLNEYLENKSVVLKTMAITGYVCDGIIVF